jgi:DNA ligase-1
MFAPRESPLKYPNYFKKLRYPLLVSAKLDGIRCLVKGAEKHEYDSAFRIIDTQMYSVAKSRTLIDLPSKQVQEEFSGFLELDGELAEGDETDKALCRRTMSYVTSDDKYSDDLKFRVFDCCDVDLADEPFEVRLEYARDLISRYSSLFPNSKVSLVEHERVKNLDELLEVEAKFLGMGYEGVMARDPLGRYKHGRGTFKEGLIYKLKRFQDDEAILVDVLPGFDNHNVDIRSNLGTAKRQTLKENMVESTRAGTLIVEFNGALIDIAPGTLTHPEREHLLAHKEEYIGRILTFHHMTHGAKDAPRFAGFFTWRDKRDI